MMATAVGSAYLTKIFTFRKEIYDLLLPLLLIVA
jgi:hypothetical protein